MNTKTVFDRLQSIDDEVQKLHNTIFALKTTDIQAYADKYEELSISAALRSERITCQLRNLVYTTTDTGKKDYLKQAAAVQGIKISFSNSVLSITMPGLLPKRKLRTNTAFLHEPLNLALQTYVAEHSIPLYKRCVVCFSQIYDQSLSLQRIRDYDVVKAFNLVNPENSDSWNCLGEINGQETMAQVFADVIIQNTGSGKGDHFWDNAEMNLLKALVLYVDQGFPPEARNIGQVYKLLTMSSEKELNSLFDLLPVSHPAKVPYCIYKQASDTVRSGVIIGLGARLQVFQNKLIRQITSYDEIDLTLPGKQKCAYFCITSDQDSTFDFLSSLFMTFIFIKLVRYADKYGEEGKLPVAVHILADELANTGAILELNKKISVIAEYPSRTGLLHVVVYNRMTGKFIAGKYEKPLDLDSKPEPYQFKKDEDSGSALYFALMPTFLSDDEFNEKYQELKQHRDDGFPDLPKAAETAAVLCDNVYRRIRYGDSLPIGNIKVDTPANGVLQRLTPLNIQKGVYAPTEIIQGTFQVLKGGHHYTASAVSIPKEDFVDKYILSNSRTLTPQEESTVPILEDWYVIPKEIQRICEHAKLTTDSKQPMRNFMLRGPAGTGKTEGAKAIAAGLHLPYRCITCSANTEIFDLLGQILPDVDEKQLSLVGELPSFQDITLDPATAYEKLTGTYDEKVSENTVYEELIHHISEEMKQKQAATSSSQQFRYVDTPLVEAIRNGYLVEIQEPTVIANPGVLVGLNSLLDRCNSVFLPNGEVIHRHPDTTIVVTTNHDYAGCRPMNQSVISRMNMVIDMDEPDEETMVERVLAITGCSDKKSVRTMTQIVRSIAQYCQDNLITDGCCGVRELIAWVQSFMVCGDIQEAAHYTILSSVTADSESRIEIEGSCLDTVLAS